VHAQLRTQACSTERLTGNYAVKETMLSALLLPCHSGMCCLADSYSPPAAPFPAPQDMFGHVNSDTSQRGRYFLFYAYHGISGGPGLWCVM
jgi:hypothetical protein